MLNPKTHYLQIALNSSLHEAKIIIQTLPSSERIILEAGTPLIKTYGSQAITYLRRLWALKSPNPYIIADLKCMDRAKTEVAIAANASASAAVVLGSAPVETINTFIATCHTTNLDSYIDMMNIDQPYKVLRKLKKPPSVVLLHRGVDEEAGSDKPLPIHMINKLKGAYDIPLGIAGGDTFREVQSSVFNGADIVVLWKNFFRADGNTAALAQKFLDKIK